MEIGLFCELGSFFFERGTLPCPKWVLEIPESWGLFPLPKLHFASHLLPGACPTLALWLPKLHFTTSLLAFTQKEPPC